MREKCDHGIGWFSSIYGEEGFLFKQTDYELFPEGPTYKFDFCPVCGERITSVLYCKEEEACPMFPAGDCDVCGFKGREE